MQRINGQGKDQAEFAKQILLWITFAKRPLITLELQHALAIEIGESQLDEENISEVDTIVSACAGLVTFDKESNIIRLVHYTTQEYFERTQSQWFPQAQADITTLCITYLSFDEFESGICPEKDKFMERLQSNKMYNYAAENWGLHAREAPTLCQSITEFIQKQAHVEASSQELFYGGAWYEEYRPFVEITGLHICAYFGPKVIAQLLLEKRTDVNAADKNGRTPLFYASQNGHVEVVQLLLEKGADVNKSGSYSDAPLYGALSFGTYRGCPAAA